MTHYETIHEEAIDGFTIRFSVTSEDHPIDWDFETEEDRQQLIDDINNGTLDYFVARVEAIKEGIVLASDYLGGCVYSSPMQFVTDNDYYADMVQTVLDEAKQTIVKLAA
jgi:hypothetical protein